MDPRIAVVGSINMDVVNRVKNLPIPGETIHSEGTEYGPGGKGANQAVGAAKAGALVTMVGAVGEDGFGAELVSSLSHFGVDSTRVVRKSGTSGLAFITVDESAQNTIVLSSGANGKVARDDVEPALQAVGSLDAVLLQNEIPWETTAWTIRYAASRGMLVVLNPAPARIVSDDVLSNVDVLVLNESEAAVLVGSPVPNMKIATKAAEALVHRGAKAVVITLGEHGALYYGSEIGSIAVPAFSVKPVDTTAAGDTFVGGFAAELARNHDVRGALTYAAAAAAIAVTKHGAQASVPSREEVEAFLRERRA